MEDTRVQTQTTVHNTRWLTDSVFVLRFDRGTIDFMPGQYVTVGPSGTIDMREYSVYSPPSAPYLEILVKVVDGGVVSRALAALQPGDPLHVDGPFGFFTIDDDWQDASYAFIATGTGISPFHAIVQSYPNIDYMLLHGTRHLSERFELETYDPNRLVRCVTRDVVTNEGSVIGEGSTTDRIVAADGRSATDTASRRHVSPIVTDGRVTTHLRSQPIDTERRYYLCGNCDMIYEVFDILQEVGVPHSHIFAEVYF